MICRKCGENLNEGDAFCSKCGTPVPKENVANNEGGNATNSYAYERPESQQNNYGKPQQPSQQTYGQQPYQTNKNSNDTVKIVVSAVIGLALIAAIVFAIYSMVSNNKEKNDGGQIASGNQNQTGEPQSNNGGTVGVTPVANTNNNRTSSYQVNYSGFKLYVPDNLIYEIDSVNRNMNIGDTSSTWLTQMVIEKASYEQIKQHKSALNTSLAQALSSMNPKIAPATVETINGVEVILMEANLAGTNTLVGVTALNSMNVAVFMVFNEDNDFNRDYLKHIVSITSTAEYTGEASYMKTNENVKVKDISDAFKKTVE